MKNIKELLTQGTALPLAIEARLPVVVPKVSTMLLDVAERVPVVPDFPIEVPDLPAVPEIPEFPLTPGGLKRYVTEVDMTPEPAKVAATIVPRKPLGEEILS